MSKREKVTLHFDLGHCPPDVELQLLTGGGETKRLTAYKDQPEKLLEHQKTNKALAMIDSEQLQRVTHFVEEAELDAEHSAMYQVVYPSRDAHPLPELALVFIHIPTEARREFIRDNPYHSNNTSFPMTLAHFGTAPEMIDNADSDEIRLAADRIKPPFETAKALIFQHPEIGSVNPMVASRVFDNHIKNTQEFQELLQYISTHSPESGQSWYKKSYASWTNPDTGKEEPIPANEDLTYKNGHQPNWPKDEKGKPVIPLYDLTDQYNTGRSGVVEASARVVQQVLVSTKNDLYFNGQLWTKQAGETQKVRTDVPPVKLKDWPPAAAPKGFSVKNTTSSYGLYLYDDEMTYNQGKLNLPVKNWPARSLGAYVQFFREDGTPIKRIDIPGWDDRMPWPLDKILEPSDSKNFLCPISAGNAIYGIPIPPLTNKTNLDLLWPQEASRAVVLLGGLGAASGFVDWDTDVDVVGTLMTALLSYGISALSLCLTVYIVNPFLKKLDKEAFFGLMSIAGVIGATALVMGITYKDTSMGKFILTKLAAQVAGIIFGVAVKQIANQVWKHAIAEIIAASVAAITAEQALEQIPYAGWALKIASVAADLAAMTATTIECLCSPATYHLEIQHTLDLTVTVRPDQAHGKPGVPPVWPAVSDHYVIQVNYPKGNNQDGGTTYTMAGPMPGKHDEPIVVTFNAIPAGGKIDVTASIYSKEDWLAGKWESGWLNADPDVNAQLKVEGSIVENLVPLTSSTSYTQKQRLNYSEAQKHYWEVTLFAIDAELSAELDAGTAGSGIRKAFSENGNPLSGNVAVTIVAPGNQWLLKDNQTTISYQIQKKQIYSTDGTTLYQLEVQNLTHAAPPLPEVINDCGSGGHRICDRNNITYNNREYQLGYAWRASGQNLPRDYGVSPDNEQMYTFQSISTLGQPQDSIIEPSRGFSNSTYIAFDQFGLTPLFDLAWETYRNMLDKGGPVPAQLRSEFAKFGLTLPADAQITVMVTGQEWNIGSPGVDPLYTLRVDKVVVQGVWKETIHVYSWPMPHVDNFYLDSRSYTPANQLYYLRGITFKKGQSTFDYDTKKSWGRFQDVTIKALAVHPSGYIIGADYENHKLLTLRLPSDAVDDDKAPYAMPLGGEGLREGLMNKPVALTVASDGRILILEEGNQRIQAFDIFGNPVPCFSVGQKTFRLNPGFINELDAQTPSIDLIKVFQENVAPELAPLFIGHTSSVDGLNRGIVDQVLVDDFKKNGYLSDDKVDISVSVTKKDQLWLITDNVTKAVYDLRLINRKLNVFHCFTFMIDIRSRSRNWRLTDTTSAMVFEVVNPGEGNDLRVRRQLSVMPLREKGQNEIAYLDIASEAKGYIYVLSVLNPGNSPVYQLDIYNPDGTPLLAKPQTGVNAAKLAVDQWRSLFTMNYDLILGPGGRTEPGISQWIPST